ncbi:MAG: hypothetical protein AAFN27_19910 [Pseudomonadota bacterium]
MSVVRGFVLTCLLVIASIGPATIALARQEPIAGEPMIVIVAPWQHALRVAARANGRFVAQGRVDSIALVWSANPAFTDSLYQHGAWLVLNSDLSSILCRTE